MTVKTKKIAAGDPEFCSFIVENKNEAIPSGIVVFTEFRYSKNGKQKVVASLKRDARTTWKVVIENAGSNPNWHRFALQKWIEEYTGINSNGFTSEFEIIARGSDTNGYYYTLQAK